MTSQRVTIRDVARVAGVSIATVSLAMADHPDVAEATKERVRQAASDLSYSPSAVGRALQARRTNSVALVVPHSGQHVFGHLYFMEVMSGVSEVLDTSGMTLVVSTSPTEADEEAAYLKILKSQLVDGVILASAALHDPNITRLQQSAHPFVYIGRYPLNSQVPTVGIDDIGGAQIATKHLLEHGHTRIAHISGPLAHLSAMERQQGYEQALRRAGVNLRREHCFEGDYSVDAGRIGMRALLNLAEPPTALFAANDETALGAIYSLREAGIEPGRDFPVVGFDDVVLAHVVSPSLTTVRQPMRQLGVIAANMLLDLLNGKQLKVFRTELPTELVVRSSCGCEPGK